jgi:predicted nucleic acid-binding protein
MNIKPGTRILVTKESDRVILQPFSSFTEKLSGLTRQSFGKTPDEVEKYGKNSKIKWPKLRTVDGLIIASALKNDVDKIISNDRHFQQALPKDLIIPFERYYE